MDVDVYGGRPTFAFNGPTIGNGEIVGELPATFGGHLVLNPISMGGLTVSLEGRGRSSFQTGTKMNEFEVVAGLKTPDTVIGCVTLRAGYRHTEIEFAKDPDVVDVTWKGVVGELVYYY